MINKLTYSSDRGMTQKMALTALFSAIAVVGSLFSFPILGAKCAPVQHIMNILSAILLGPWFALAQAFLVSAIRNAFGLGTIFAFPGSMFGAFLSGLLYQYTKKHIGAYVGEVFGTSILGGLASYPLAVFVLGSSKVALFGFVFPFFTSTAGGTIIASLLVTAISKRFR